MTSPRSNRAFALSLAITLAMTLAGARAVAQSAGACTRNAECVPDAPCMATRCVHPRRVRPTAGCPDVVEATRLSCRCVEGRCRGRRVPAPGAPTL